MNEWMAQMMGCPMMSVMMGSAGLLLLLIVAVLILSLVALVKYLRGPR